MIRILKEQYLEMIELGLINNNAKQRNYAIASRHKSSKAKTYYVQDNVWSTYKRKILVKSK